MYQPPQSAPESTVDLSTLRRRRKFWLRAIWISLAGVVLPPLIGMAGAAAAMVGAFGELSQTGSADPSELADHVSVSLLTTMGGLAVSLLFFVVLIGALIRFFTLPRVPAAPSRQP